MAQKNTHQQKLVRFKKELYGEMLANGISSEDLSETLRMSLKTFYRKRNNPELFTVRELLIIQDVFPGINLL